MSMKSDELTEKIRQIERPGKNEEREIPEESRGAVKKAMNLLTYKDRSEKELRDRLAAEGFEEAQIADALNYVGAFGYINDKRYAENYVASYAGKKSRNAIRLELRKKGVDENWIDLALEDVPEDETEQMKELLVRKAGPPHRLEDREKRRLCAFLGRRGYSTGAVWKAIRSYEEEDPD
ncbi:MAG: regulatory protein RecX [Bilifractor sp.]|jgi:regulatory protein